MTIAISLKVNDGVVLAADSATTLVQKGPDGAQAVLNVYNNGNKLFNVCKGLPVGMMTWGSGSIRNISIETLAKDFRQELSVGEAALDPKLYQVKDIALRLKRFFYDERYEPFFRSWNQKPAIGFIVAGYSSKGEMAEEYRIDIRDGVCSGPAAIRKTEECGLNWNGEPEAISRLVLGFSPQLSAILVQDLGVPQPEAEKALAIIRGRLMEPLVVPAMPIQDAIDLASFLVETTIQFSRFRPGAPTVGGPLEIATITKHEGFKWIRRKRYYSADLNPEGQEVRRG